MVRPVPTWAVYRRAERDGEAHLDLVGIVAADFEGQAVALAAMLPEAPRYPVLCRAMAVPGRAPTLTLADLAATVLPGPVVAVGRRSRKRRIVGAAAVAQAVAA